MNKNEVIIGKTIENCIKDKLGVKLLGVIPYDNQISGEKGYILYTDNRTLEGIPNGVAHIKRIDGKDAYVTHEEIQIKIPIKVYENVKTITYYTKDDFDKFSAFFDICYASDFILEKYDDIKDLKAGFIVRKRSGSYCYMADYKDIYINHETSVAKFIVGNNFSNIEGVK